MTWQQVALTGGVALLTAIAAGWFQRPKVQAEVRRSETDEEIAIRELRLKEQAEALRSAWAARDDARASAVEAKAACTQCEETTRRIIEASDNLADAVQSLIDEPGDIAARQTARVRLREYRQAI